MARDTMVDSIIFNAKIDKDPMADASRPAEAKPMPSRGRASAFTQADVPATILLQMAAFVTPDGERVDGHAVRVVTTPKRRVNVTMEATANNFEWLLHAAQVEWDTGARIAKRSFPDDDDDELPELTAPCKYLKTEGGKLKILCSYRHQGVWKKHQRAVSLNICAENSSLETMIRRCEAEVLEFYNSHHESAGQGGEHHEPEPTPLMM